ncbi:MAG: TIM44-like domain-containing protein [Kiritimatiellia bacterium]
MNRSFLFFCFAFLAAIFSPAAFGRGGGGCFIEGTPVAVPGGTAAIERLAVGDRVIVPDGLHDKTSAVCAVTAVEPGSALELLIGGRRLFVTESHPFQISPGVFVEARGLKAGDKVRICEGENTRSAAVESIRRVPAAGRFHDILVMPGGLYVADGVIVHNKGCFLPETLITKADGRAVRISEIKAGDRVLAFDKNANIQTAAVLEVTTRSAEGYLALSTDRATLNVTAEHPFYVGEGMFKTIGALKTNDTIFAYDGSKLAAQKILEIREIPGPVAVYNLKTDAPNTFFAGGIAVHNKGGGCFLPDTLITKADGKQARISEIKTGDRVMALCSCGGIEQTSVRELTTRQADGYLAVSADNVTLKVTGEHPFYAGSGVYKPIGEFKTNEVIYALAGGQLAARKISEIKSIPGPVTVYNLKTDEPNTFFANGIAVHNKGGGGFRSSGSRRSGSRSSKEDDLLLKLFFFGLILPAFILSLIISHGKKARENLDYVFPRDEIEPKAEKTRKLLEFIARVDQDFEPVKLTAMAKEVFLKLQECWQARAYEPMRPLMAPDLFAEHERQLAAMKAQHEINRMEGLRVDAIDIVHVRYMNDPAQREFTALITATMKDFYVDDRTGKILRGDDSEAMFQEFWTFHRQGSKWVLGEIEQTKESKALKEENLFEQFTKTGLEQVYGAAAAAAGVAGPLLEKAVELKTNKIDRLLNFLAKTDSKMWNRQEMLERAREVFISVMLYEQTGNNSDLKESLMIPEVAGAIKKKVSENISRGFILELRNLCIRKVEMVLVRNYADDKLDEYTVRIRAHAQQITRLGGNVVKQDEDVTPFEEYWSFGRHGNEWKLKEILPPAAGEKAVGAENLDEDSSREMLKWYYTQERAN